MINHIEHRLRLAERIANSQRIVDRRIAYLLELQHGGRCVDPSEWDRAEHMLQAVDRWREELKDLGG